MTMENVETSILNEAEMKAKKILEEGQAERAKLLEESRGSVENEKEKIKLDFDEKMIQFEKKELASARMSAKKDVLLEKKKILEETYEKFEELVSTELDKKELLSSLYELGKKDLTDIKIIYVNKADLDIAKEIFSDEVQEKDIRGGLILESNNNELVDMSLDTLVELIKNSSIKKVSNILFGE